MTKASKNTTKKIKTEKEVKVEKMDSKKEVKLEKQDKTKETIKVVKEKDKKSLGQKIFDIVFWVAIIILAFVWLTDFIRLQNEKEPVFCLTEKTHKFKDGTVDECIGLGYKIYDYNRESINIKHQFSPFFVGMKK